LLIPLALLHANFVLDTTITIVRRVVRGDKWHHAHREHFYQRLVRSGKSHTFATSCEIGLQVVVLGLVLAYVRASEPVRWGLIATVIAIWSAFFAFCEIEFRKGNRRPQGIGSAHGVQSAT
jgi:phospho-N-acetylmuramoyl-pentapeptide-transferase